MRERVWRPLSLARVPTLPKRQGRSSVPTLSPNGVARLVRGTRNYTPLPRVLAKADGGERGFRGSLSVRQQPIADPFEGAVMESVSSTGRSSQVQLANRRGRVVVAGQRGSLLLAKVVVSASPRPSHGRKWHNHHPSGRTGIRTRPQHPPPGALTNTPEVWRCPGCRP